MVIENTSNDGPVGTNEALIEEIELAIKISQNLTEMLNRGAGGRENSLVTTKLQEAYHWALETRTLLAGGN